MISILKSIWGFVRGPEKSADQSPLESSDIPQWKTEVVIHPNYWIQSNYTLIEKLPPSLVKLMSKALQEGYIKDVSREMAQDSINLLRETIIIQLHESISKDEGVWTVQGKDGTIVISIKMGHESKWHHAVMAWSNTKATVLSQGLQLNLVKEEWDRTKLTGIVQIPVEKIQLALDSTILWNVLHRNRKSTILWQNKLWVPK